MGKLTSPLLDRYLCPPDDEVYQSVMKKRGLQPEVVQLPHGTEGYWIGNKNAKNVIVYYHGMYNHVHTKLTRHRVTSTLSQDLPRLKANL